MSDRKVIALTGKAGSGKDTVADYLNQTHYYHKYSFAYPIRQILKIALNLSDNQIYDNDYKNVALPNYPHTTVRKCLQMVGTEMFRDMIDKNIWCKNLLHRVSSSSDRLIVITDCRFPNEKQLLVDEYGDNCIFIKIVRDGCDGNVGIKKHESEAYEIKCDYTIDNNGSKEELYAATEQLVTEINFDK